MDEVLGPVAIGGPRLGRKPPATPRSSISTINTAVGAALAQDFHQKTGEPMGMETTTRKIRSALESRESAGLHFLVNRMKDLVVST